MKPINPNEAIRITTTAAKANALADAGRGIAFARDRAGIPDPVLVEAVAEVIDALGQPERRRLYRATLLDHGYPKPQEPSREAGGMHDDYAEIHPAYAMIGASRTSGGATLAGSDFSHQAYMTIAIKRASLRRGHSSDHWFAGEEIIEVALSEAQWATFVSATNMGDGVPCTLHWTEQDGYLPRIVAITNRREQVNDEVKQALAEAVAGLDDILSTPNITKAVREKAQRARMRLTDSVPYVVARADEHMENTIEHAKIEVEAYVVGMVQRAGIAALTGEKPILALNTGDDRD